MSLTVKAGVPSLDVSAQSSQMQYSVSNLHLEMGSLGARGLGLIYGKNTSHRMLLETKFITIVSGIKIDLEILKNGITLKLRRDNETIRRIKQFYFLSCC